MYTYYCRYAGYFMLNHAKVDTMGIGMHMYNTYSASPTSNWKEHNTLEALFLIFFPGRLIGLVVCQISFF